MSHARRVPWIALHQRLVKEATLYRNPLGLPSLLLVGDSLMEAYRGPYMPQARNLTAVGYALQSVPVDARGVLASTLSLDFPHKLILACSADQTQHVLWRLQEELSASLRSDSSLFIGLLIGTNNLFNAQHSIEHTAQGILAVARMLLERTHGRLLVHALLPRCDVHLLRQTCEPRLFNATIAVNELVTHGINVDLALRFPGRVRREDCGHVFFERSERRNRTALMWRQLFADGVHPSLEGSRRLAACMRGAFASWRGAAYNRSAHLLRV